MTEANGQPAEREEPSGSSFDFSFKLCGRQAAGDASQLSRLLEETARRLAAATPDGAPALGSDASIEFKDGVLSIVSGEQEKFALDLASGRSRGPVADPFPLISRIRRWVNLAVTAVSLAIPIGLIGIGVATSQTFETTFYMGLFGVIIAVMLMSSLRLKRSPVEDLLPLLLHNGARRQSGDVERTTDEKPQSPFPRL